MENIDTDIKLKGLKGENTFSASRTKSKNLQCRQ